MPMFSDPRLSKYVFETHSLDTIRRWATALEVFRFCRASGGHQSGGDQFLAALSYDGEADYRTLLEALGLEAVEIPPGTPDPVKGTAYSGAEWKQFPSRISGLPHLRQPGHAEIGGERCFVWASSGRLTLSVHGPLPSEWEVDETTFERARRVERRIAELSDRVIDPPLDSRMCICPQRYPAIWSTNG